MFKLYELVTMQNQTNFLCNADRVSDSCELQRDRNNCIPCNVHNGLSLSFHYGKYLTMETCSTLKANNIRQHAS